MNFQQLRIIREAVQRNFNLTEVANALFTSQSGVSKHILDLENELGIELFVRKGKRLTGLTEPGKELVGIVERMLIDAKNIKRLAEQFANRDEGSLTIATTHTQARYALPGVIQSFRTEYPEVILHMNQGTPLQIAEMAADGSVDFGIATEGSDLFGDLVMMPCYEWNRSVVVPKGHPLIDVKPLTLEAVAAEPIVTYVFGFTGRSKLDDAFIERGLSPHVVFTATDTDVIKTYVRLGLGVGIVAAMSYHPEQDADLVALDASHLFRPSVTYIACRKGAFMRRFMFDFIELFAPHLTRDVVERALACTNRVEREAMFQGLKLPTR